MKKITSFLNLEYKSLAILLVLWHVSSFAVLSNSVNDSLLQVYGLKQFEINEVNFLVYKKNDVPKPTIVFIGGSGFAPLFVNGLFYGFPFNMYQFADEYNFVVMSKPGIPIFCDSTSNKYINQTFTQGYYVENSGEVPELFLKKNNRPYYVKSYQVILDFLLKKKWVLKDEMIVMGHSQGSKIAVQLSLQDDRVTRFILLAPGSNRFYESIRKIRVSQFRNEQSVEAAQHKIDSVYLRHDSLLTNIDNNDDFFDGGTYYSYGSFNYPSFNEILLNTDKKTLVLYGTSSMQDLDCDFLPFLLQKQIKKNIKVVPLIGYDHNFFTNELKKDGKTYQKVFHWNDVVKKALDLIKE